MSKKLIVAPVIALIGVIMGAVALSAQTDGQTRTIEVDAGESVNIELEEGAHLIVDCPEEFDVNDHSMSPGYLDADCGEFVETPPTSEPTNTPDQEPTNTPEPEPTNTSEPEPTNTPEPEPTEPPSSGNPNSWHGPTDHEHGEAPPAWVTEFSQENFGHGLIYGGDEGTPNENVYKHAGFKGYHVEFDGAELYYRNHLMSTPLGHNGRYHSYEMYALDPSGNVSFWQGWLDFGTGSSDTPTVRINGCEDTTVRPIIAVNVAEGCGGDTFESWYSEAGGSGGWSWDTGVNLDPNYYHGQSQSNPSDPNDQSTWIDRGSDGTNRRVELAWYDDRTPDQLEDQWFCATVNGELLGAADGPQGCDEGLPQYIASTMPSVTFPDNSEQTDYPCPSCEGLN